LLADGLAHPMHPVPAAWTNLLVFRKIMLDTFARQIFRQWLAASLLRPRWFRVGQFRRDDGRCLGIITFGRRLLSFIEDALFTLLAPRREAMQGERPVSQFCLGAKVAQVTSQMIHL